MTYFGLLILIVIVTLIPQAFGLDQNMFYGTSSIEKVPETIIPGTSYEFEIKFQYTESEYWLRNIYPEIQVSPQSAESYVHVDVERISIHPHAISRTPMTLYVDPAIPYEKIFLNVSFVSENSVGTELRSSWMTPMILNIGTNHTTAETQSKQMTKHDVLKLEQNGRLIPPLNQVNLGVQPNQVKCNDELILLQKHDGAPACVKQETKQKLIERGWSKDSKYSAVEKLLTENKIEYLPDKLVITGGPAFMGDPGCGAAVDASSKVYWFGIDSVSNPSRMTIFDDNPNQCVVNTSSCFCNVQIKLAALTTDELDYFSPEEQEKYASILIDYLYEENINRTPKFMIGKHNVNYTEPSAVGYCGKIWGTATRDYFSGAIVNGEVKGYGIDKELPLLCAISDDAPYFGKAFGEK